MSPLEQLKIKKKSKFHILKKRLLFRISKRVPSKTNCSQNIQFAQIKQIENSIPIINQTAKV